MFSSRVRSAILLSLVVIAPVLVQGQPGLYVDGRYLLTPCGDTVIIRGVNKMSIWTDDLDIRKATYAEIKKTGANCVRIVWLAQPTPFEQDAGPDGLDRTIQDAIDAGLIPMVELHDATGDFSRLPIAVNYWTSDEVAAVVKKHERYLLVNIANEAGDETVTDEQFTTAYTSAVTALRQAGIRTPLVIDAADWGKNLAQLVRVGSPLQLADPDHNLLFSVHTYWAISDGADAGFIEAQVKGAVDAELPFIVGEFTEYFNRDDQCTLQTDYQALMEICHRYRIGWLAWEWGPGNEFADPTCEIMNMTTNSTYATLRDTWARTVATGSAYGISNTSVTHYFTAHHGACDPTGIREGKGAEPQVHVSPNPSAGQPTLTIAGLAKGGCQIRVVDALGSLVYSAALPSVSYDLWSIELPASAAGTYYYVVTSRSDLTTGSFVVLR